MIFRVFITASICLALFIFSPSLSAHAGSNSDASLCIKISRDFPAGLNKPQIWHEKRVCGAKEISEIDSRLKDYHDFPLYKSPEFAKSDKTFRVESFYSNGDPSYAATVSERGYLSISEFYHPPLYQDSHHFLDFLQQEARLLREPRNNGACEDTNQDKITVHYLPWVSAFDEHWNVCGKEREKYESFLRELQPLPENTKESCNYAINHQAEYALVGANNFAGEMVYVCPGVLSIGSVSRINDITVHDVKNLYQYLKKKYSLH